jgi:hypothetical protein
LGGKGEARRRSGRGAVGGTRGGDGLRETRGGDRLRGSNGKPNRARNRVGWSAWAGRPRPFLTWFGPVFLPTAYLDILDLYPFICVILALSSPRSR